MSDVGKEVIKTIITLVTTAFGLVAGLAWNDAIQALISNFSKQEVHLPVKSFML